MEPVRYFIEPQTSDVLLRSILALGDARPSLTPLDASHPNYLVYESQRIIHCCLTPNWRLSSKGFLYKHTLCLCDLGTPEARCQCLAGNIDKGIALVCVGRLVDAFYEIVDSRAWRTVIRAVSYLEGTTKYLDAHTQRQLEYVAYAARCVFDKIIDHAPELISFFDDLTSFNGQWGVRTHLSLNTASFVKMERWFYPKYSLVATDVL